MSPTKTQTELIYLKRITGARDIDELKRALLLANISHCNLFARPFLGSGFLHASEDDLHFSCRNTDKIEAEDLPDIDQIESAEWAAKILSGDFTKADLIVFPNEISNLMDTKDWFTA